MIDESRRLNPEEEEVIFSAVAIATHAVSLSEGDIIRGISFVDSLPKRNELNEYVLDLVQRGMMGALGDQTIDIEVDDD